MSMFRSFEAFQNALVDKNLLAWAVVVIVMVLLLRLMVKASRWILIVLGVLIVAFVFGNFFPDLFKPVGEFIQGGWLDY